MGPVIIILDRKILSVKRKRIIIADGNRYFREGLRRVIQNMASVDIVGEAESGPDLVALMERCEADIIFLDLVLPGVPSHEVVESGHRKYPRTRFIAFTSLDNPRYLRRMVEAGIAGYLLKSSDNLDLLYDILNGSGRDFFLSPGMQQPALGFRNHGLTKMENRTS